ncbi:MAG: HMA2 domain-containing protein [Bacillus sp. (in: firmicutes)]
MFEQLKLVVTRKAVEHELKKYGLELKHYIPGRVRIGLVNWKDKQDVLEKLLADLESDPDIQSVTYTKETSSVLIYYNHQAIKQEQTQRNWYSIMQKYI